MKLGILSDVHGNYEALKRAIEILEMEGAEKLVCLGDIVGYGPSPSECIRKVRESCDTVVLGNHDAAIIGKEDPHRFNRYALISNIWTAEQLSPEDKDYLSSLPYTKNDEKDSYLLVHASPFQPEYFNYILSPNDALFEFQEFEEKVCFIGHSHKPAIFSSSGFLVIPNIMEKSIDDDNRYIINVGSVGQPRDGDSRGCVALYDTWRKTIRHIRFEYPIEITQRKIESFNLPDFLAERLSRGM